MTTTASDDVRTARSFGEGDGGPEPGQQGVSRLRLVIQPLAVLAVVAAVLVYVNVANFNPTEAGLLNNQALADLTWQHVKLTVVTAIVVIVVAVPAGVLLTRRKARSARPGVVGVANFGQAAPAVGLLVVVATLLGIGFQTAVIALALYGILPTLRNTMTGLEQVDPQLVEAGRGMGMSARGALMRIELPLAVPVILTGIRLSLVLIVGTAALAAFIGAGGLGQLIITGVNLQLDNQLLVGAVLIASLALLVDWLGHVVEEVARPKGLS